MLTSGFSDIDAMPTGKNTIHNGDIKFLKACKKVGLNPLHDLFAGLTIDDKIADAKKNRISVQEQTE